MAYLQQRVGMEKQGSFLFKLLAKYPKTSLAGLGLGAAYLYRKGRQASVQLEDWQKDPTVGMDRTYVNSNWSLK